MPTRIILLRHAESASPNVFNGAESDVDLSTRGQRQAEAVAPVVVAYNLAAVISSGMQRAMKTATPIAELSGLTLQVEQDLHERRVGDLSGQSYDGLNGVWPKTVKQWMAGNIEYASHGAESLHDMQQRLLPVWDRLLETYREQTIAVVAHGVVCKVLLVSLLPDKSPADWNALGPIYNVGIHELVHDGDWRLERLNHIADEVKAIL